MAMIAINGLSDKQRNQLQVMAGRVAARECRRMSMSGLAREIITNWLAENCPEEQDVVVPEPIKVPQAALDAQKASFPIHQRQAEDEAHGKAYPSP